MWALHYGDVPISFKQILAFAHTRPTPQVVAAQPVAVAV
jgi:hypothetical protein